MIGREPILIECEEPSRLQFTEAKAYARIADNGSDSQFMSCLRQAMREVQSYADTSLLRATLEVSVEERESNTPVRLYQSVDEVLSVTDGEGNSIAYSRRGRLIFPGFFSEVVVVRYTTRPNPAEALRYKNTYEQLATAKFDGNLEEEAKIKRSIC